MCNVKIDNSTLSVIVNGYPGDLIELCPFDSIFTHNNIWKWWCKVDFIPMNCNSLRDEKVCQQLGGPSVAVGDHGRNIKLLVKDYKWIAEEVTNLGFKGEMLNIEIKVAKPQQLLNDMEKLVEKIMEDNAMTSTVQLFKLWVQVANTGAMTKAGHKKVELMETKKQNRSRQRPKGKLQSRWKLLIYLRNLRLLANHQNCLQRIQRHTSICPSPIGPHWKIVQI